jgi:hypothetical protein
MVKSFSINLYYMAPFIMSSQTKDTFPGTAVCLGNTYALVEAIEQTASKTGDRFKPNLERRRATRLQQNPLLSLLRNRASYQYEGG